MTGRRGLKTLLVASAKRLKGHANSLFWACEIFLNTSYFRTVHVPEIVYNVMSFQQSELNMLYIEIDVHYFKIVCKLITVQLNNSDGKYKCFVGSKTERKAIFLKLNVQ